MVDLLRIGYLFDQIQSSELVSLRKEEIITSMNALFNGFGVVSADDSLATTGCAKSNETKTRYFIVIFFQVFKTLT